MKELEVGKPCMVIMTEGGVFSNLPKWKFEATLLRVPQDIGDFYRFDVDGKIIAINPVCTLFVGVEQEQEQK